jgi:hypothetical protein
MKASKPLGIEGRFMNDMSSFSGGMMITPEVG